MSRSYTGTQIMIGILGGVAAGAAVALLTAPKSGKETRDFIASRAREGKDVIVEKTRVARERLAHPMRSSNMPPAVEDAYHAAAVAAQNAFLAAFDARTEELTSHH